jgi:hypothetical protein
MASAVPIKMNCWEDFFQHGQLPFTQSQVTRSLRSVCIADVNAEKVINFILFSNSSSFIGVSLAVAVISYLGYTIGFCRNDYEYEQTV